MKKTAKLNKKKIGIICAVCAIVLALAVGIILWIVLFSEEKPSENIENLLNLNGNNPVVFEEIDVGDGIVLTKLSEASGAFPEDGSGEQVESVLVAAFKNTTDKTLQYAKVRVSVGEKIYNFEFSTIPAGKSVYAFETAKSSAKELSGDISAKAEYIVFFNEEPTLLEDALEITVKDGAVIVKNISGVDIDREISVFYKNKLEDTYLGGITYRLRIPAVKAGETVSGYASHAFEDATEVMFCQYGVQ